MGGTRQRRFDGISLKPRKVLENAQTPTSLVHAVLGGERVDSRLLYGVESTELSLQLEGVHLVAERGDCFRTQKPFQVFQVGLLKVAQE